MTKEELAQKLNGGDCEHTPLLTKEETEQAKKDGLVVVYGASDDLMEIEGAIDDEEDCYDGGEIFIDKNGILPDYDEIDEDDLPEYLERKRKAEKIFALWCTEEDFAWAYKTRIPHAIFVMSDKNNDDATYCRGIVFDVSQMKF